MLKRIGICICFLTLVLTSSILSVYIIGLGELSNNNECPILLLDNSTFTLTYDIYSLFRESYKDKNNIGLNIISQCYSADDTALLFLNDELISRIDDTNIYDCKQNILFNIDDNTIYDTQNIIYHYDKDINTDFKGWHPEYSPHLKIYINDTLISEAIGIVDVKYEYFTWNITNYNFIHNDITILMVIKESFKLKDIYGLDNYDTCNSFIRFGSIIVIIILCAFLIILLKIGYKKFFEHL